VSRPCPVALPAGAVEHTSRRARRRITRSGADLTPRGHGNLALVT
jgi:hypothetical protein